MGTAIDIRGRFDAQLRVITGGHEYQLTFLPETLTRIVAQLLPVAGVSLSVLSEELRMPLAASDEHARAAESAQFTVGDGPCLDAYRTGQRQTFSRDQLAQRWPLYLDELAQHTPYRSVASLPLDFGRRLIGALDLYLVSEDGLTSAALADATFMADLVADTLSLSAHAGDGVDSSEWGGPVWLRNAATQRRALSWIAIGIVSRAVDLNAADALDVVRAYAWQHGRTLDEVSYDLASHTLTADDLLGG